MKYEEGELKAQLSKVLRLKANLMSGEFSDTTLIAEHLSRAEASLGKTLVQLWVSGAITITFN